MRIEARGTDVTRIEKMTIGNQSKRRVRKERKDKRRQEKIRTLDGRPR
jgi:hypothetical protein